MKRLAALLIPFLFALTVSAQQGNEWINYGQSYLKIPVAADGIYRVTYQALQSAGFPVTGIAPKKLQLYHRGKEQAIIVNGEADNAFDPTDYLEFYGQKNDGTLDSKLYNDPAQQPHSLYNIYSDTTSYFLTAGASNGKRAALFQENNSGLTNEQFHNNEKLLVLTNEYAVGHDYGEVFLTTFDQGEGWMSSMILYNQPATLFTLTGIDLQNQSSGKPVLDLALTGRGDKQHPVDIFVGNNRLLQSVEVSGYETLKVKQEIEWSDINGQGVLNIAIKVNGDGTRVSANYFKLSYHQETDMNSLPAYVFNLTANSRNKSFIQITNAPANTRLFDITDPDNIRSIGIQSTGPLSAVINQTETGRKILASSMTITPSLKKVSFRQINSATDYVIISHSLLRKSAGGYADPVKAYGEYRASKAGGGYDTLIVNIDQLYDQFNYGEQSPLAIMNFVKFLSSTKPPQYLLIIGKGLEVYYDYYRHANLYTQNKSFVPAAGYPASDIAFSAKINGTSYYPSIATGRITATKPEDVANYLNKIKEADARPFDDLRRKNILHLSGGIYAGEPQQFRSYLEEIAPIAKKYYLGGSVSAIAKLSTDLKLINIAEEVNKGLDLVTFFGHSSPGSLDFDVGYVSDPVMGYKNKGKYPVLLMNGCDAGAFFLNQQLFGEDWINAKDKGAIGFLAHTSFGFVGPLRTFTTLFYDVGYADSIYVTKGIGDIHKEVSKRYLENSGSSSLDISQAQQMILLGDPAAKLFGAPYADYAIVDENVSISPLSDEPVTAASDSFAISFIVRNYGQAKKTPLRIEITRILADRSTIIYDSVYAPVLYSDTLSFLIRGKNLKGFGSNTFAVKLDVNNEVDELREDNNIGYLDFFIPLNSTQNLYPQKFAIVNSKDIRFSFQHTDILSGKRDFILEIDTVSTFESSFKKTFAISATVLASQSVSLLDNDTLAYYWRTKLAQPLDNESKEWNNSSFTFIHNGPSGWAQVHFPQFIENTSRGLVQDAVLRKIKFEETKVDISVKTFGAGANQPANNVSVIIDNAEYNLYQQGLGCRNNAFALVAFDRKSTTPYMGVSFEWFNSAGRACGRVPWVINTFTSAQMVTGNNDDLIQYVDNVASGDSVLMFNLGDAGYASWPAAAKAKLSEFGLSESQIDDLQSGEPVVILGCKGISPGLAKIFRASNQPAANATLQVNASVTGRFTSGEIRSVLIGPAEKWEQAMLRTSEAEINDITGVDVKGVTAKGVEELLFSDVSSFQDLSGVDATIYPNLRLVYKTSDDLHLTATQLNKWIVTYEPVTEGLIFYNGTRDRETVSEGVKWISSYGFVNVSDKTYPDSLSVLYKIFNHKNLTSLQQNLKIVPPPPGDTTFFSISVNTFQKQGLNDVEVFVNPRLIPEQYYDNNIFVLPNHLNVVGEVYNPVLDVSIDGRYIENDEFVSSSPEVLVKVWDENKNLLKKDTTGISLFLAYPCDQEECQFQRISFSQQNVVWSPATDTSEFKIRFNPTQLPDGKYTFRIEARDETGNPSAAEPFEISFRVRSEVTVTVSKPYPNPTSDEVNFKILITGERPAVGIQVQIISLNGVVIQKADLSTSPALHVGNNIIPWQATNADGSLLPSGIYIYRLTVTTAEKTTELRGKISIVR